MSDEQPPAAFFNPYAVAIDDQVAIALLAEMHITKAIERGDFDDLPGAGKPLDLQDLHDPDWWLKAFMRRERLVVLPPSIQLRKDDAALDGRLDEMWSEDDVREEVEEFNRNVLRARYQPAAGPPLVTMPRDVDATVAAWAQRRAARAAQAREQRQAEAPGDGGRRRRRSRRRGRSRAVGTGTDATTPPTPG
ncbi:MULTISPECIES: DnaJ family domain-containing protein [unclassified Isoptericola]|uniref:DnaJ family domain-containing protein n=1 Tax=unclassified Isoptericola TaxID=2623355 RepID=UPI0036490B01